MSSFWNGWIVVLTIANIVGALALLYATSKTRTEGEPKAGDTTGHTWDGDLKEYNNPLPRWWLYLFYGTVAFAIGYVVLYPCGATRPNAAHVNFVAGSTMSNMVISDVAADGTVCVYTMTDTNVVVDVTGYHS